MKEEFYKYFPFYAGLSILTGTFLSQTLTVPLWIILVLLVIIFLLTLYKKLFIFLLLTVLAFINAFKPHATKIQRVPFDFFARPCIEKEQGFIPLKIDSIRINNKTFQFSKKTFVFTYRKLLLDNYITGKAYFDEGQKLHLIKPFTVHYIPEKGIISSIKRSLKYKIQRIFTHSNTDIVKGLVLGGSHWLKPEEKETIKQAGIMHIFVISGLHVGIVAGFVLMLLIPFGFINKWIRLMIIATAMSLYIAIAGFTTPSIRAGIMLLFILIGKSIERKTFLRNNLSWALIFILLASPASILSISFQLSFAATFGIVGILEHIKKHSFFTSFFISIYAFLSVLPIILIHFKNAYLISPITNTVILPFITLLLPALLTILALPLKIGMFLSPFLNFLISQVLYIIHFINRFSIPIFSSEINPYVLLPFPLIPFFIKKKKLLLSTVFLLLSFALIFPYINKNPPHFIEYNNNIVYNSQDLNLIFIDKPSKIAYLKRMLKAYRSVNSIFLINEQDYVLKDSIYKLFLPRKQTFLVQYGTYTIFTRHETLTYLNDFLKRFITNGKDTVFLKPRLPHY